MKVAWHSERSEPQRRLTQSKNPQAASVETISKRVQTNDAIEMKTQSAPLTSP